MKFVTLGPAGSNHEFVTRLYLDFHGLRDSAMLELASDFEQCADAVLHGGADFMVQCAVHPAAMSTVAKYFVGLHLIDAFISPSQDLAILERLDAVQPTSLAVMRPTLPYIDHSRWERIEFVETVAAVTQGLIDGKYAVGLAYASAAERHPEHLRMTQFIGTVDDAWMVFGRTRVSTGRLTAWHDSPAAHLFRLAA
jgi:hypothetical protein